MKKDPQAFKNCQRLVSLENLKLEPIIRLAQRHSSKFSVIIYLHFSLELDVILLTAVLRKVMAYFYLSEFSITILSSLRHVKDFVHVRVRLGCVHLVSVLINFIFFVTDQPASYACVLGLSRLTFVIESRLYLSGWRTF